MRTRFLYTTLLMIVLCFYSVYSPQYSFADDHKRYTLPSMMCEELETLHQIYFTSLAEEIQAMEAALEAAAFSVEGQPSSEAGTDAMYTDTEESVASSMSVSMALPDPSESQAVSYRYTQDQEHCMAATITPSMPMIALAQRIQPDAELACSHIHHVQASIENTEALLPLLQFIAYGRSTADFLTLVVQDLKELSTGRSAVSNLFVVTPGILQQTIANFEKGQEIQERLLDELLQVHEHAQLGGEVHTIIQQQTLGMEKLLTVLQGLKQLQELLEQQEESTSSKDRISENSHPPPPGGSGGAFPMSATLQGMQRPDCSTYSSGENICSLQGLQCILSPTVEHAVQSLKTLVLQTQSRRDRAYCPHVSLVENGPSCPNNRSSRRSICLSSSLLQQNYRREPLRSLYDSDVQWNPKKRGQQNTGTPHSSAARLILTPLTVCNVGITCSHTTHPSKEYSGIEGGNALGLARARTYVQSFSAAAVWNTDKQGITASLATCYGWGKTKNIRSIMKKNGTIRTYGIPTMGLKGGLFQVGYNFLSNAMVWTVFVETIHVRSRWNAYKETCSPFPSQISTTKAIRQEKSVGIRSHWNISNTANVQTWFVKTYGRRKAKEISSLPYATSVQQLKLTLPAVTSTTSQNEIGISVTTNVSDTVEIRFQGATQYRQFRNTQQSYIHLLLHYLY